MGTAEGRKDRAQESRDRHASDEPLSSAATSRVPAGRIEAIDVLRGLAIVLIVFGHAISEVGRLTDASYLFRLVYSFHVPLFFFISGVVGWRGISRPLLRQLRTKALSLLVPFFAWYALVTAVNLVLGRGPDLGTAAWNLISELGNYSLWFLWALFIISMLAAVVVRLTGPRYAWIGFAFVTLALVKIPVGVLGIGFVRYYFPVFAAGLLFGPLLLERSLLDRPGVGWEDLLVALVFAVLVFGWRWPNEEVPLARLWSETGLRGHTWLNLLYRYTTAATGIATSVALVRRLPPGRLRLTLSYLGCSTLEIYVSHNFILYAFAGAGLVWAIPLTAVAIGGSLLLAAALERIPGVGFILYGGRSRRARRASQPV